MIAVRCRSDVMLCVPLRRDKQCDTHYRTEHWSVRLVLALQLRISPLWYSLYPSGDLWAVAAHLYFHSIYVQGERIIFIILVVDLLLLSHSELWTPIWTPLDPVLQPPKESSSLRTTNLQSWCQSINRIVVERSMWISNITSSGNKLLPIEFDCDIVKAAIWLLTFSPKRYVGRNSRSFGLGWEWPLRFNYQIEGDYWICSIWRHRTVDLIWFTRAFICLK